MKPLQVAILVAVSAVAGGLFMKWQISRNTVQPTETAAAPAPVAAPAPASPVAEAPRPAEPPKALPAAKPKTPKIHEKPREVLKAHRVQPVVVARNEEPAAEAPPAVLTQAPVASAAQEATAAVAQTPEPEPAPQPSITTPPTPPAPQAPPAPQVTLKAGMLIPVRTVERLSSDHNSPGDGFTATLEQPLVVDGWVIAERGARLEGKVVNAQRAGVGKGKSDLAVVLTQLKTSDGQRVAIETETYEKHAEASTGESAGKVIAGTAIGAAIGAIAGGGKGAGIGAAVGTAAGAGGAAATRNKTVSLPAETRIDFRLRNPITITQRQGARS